MVIYIPHQKAASIAKKHAVPFPKKGEEFLVGKVGAKLGKAYDQLMGRDCYIKLYGDNSSISAGKKEFNI